MQAQGNELHPSRDGVLFVSGYATSLRVERGHLLVRSGGGRAIRQARFSRVSRPRLRRLVVYGKGGSVTFEALAWLHAIGCAFVHLSRDGAVIVSSGDAQGGQSVLRRAQALAMGSDVGLELIKLVLTDKLEGQLRVIGEVSGNDAASAVISAARGRLDEVGTWEQAMATEAQAAIAYWSAWESEPLRFARSDLGKVPDHWRTVGTRRSALTVTSPRLATTPAQAATNYVYGLAEFACAIALRAAGLDPGLGWLHRDAPYRASAALDVLEAIRPVADAFVLDLIRSRTFSRREFGELPSGQVRLSSSLAKQIAHAALPMLESSVQPIVNDVVTILGATTRSPVRARGRKVPVKLAAVQARPLARTRKTRTPITSACRLCGLILDDPERSICDDCLPEYDRERTAKLSAAGKATLSRMRAAGADDPARSAKAVAKRAESSRKSVLAIRAWEREHGRGFDHDDYEQRVLPAIRALTVPELIAVTRLSQSYCWRVRKGTKNLHAMHWEAVVALAGKRAGSSS